MVSVDQTVLFWVVAWMPWIASQLVDLQANCSTHEVQWQKNSCHRKCCGSVVGSMSCQWQNEDFSDHDRQPVECQQPDTSMSDQTTTDTQDRRSWTYLLTYSEMACCANRHRGSRLWWRCCRACGVECLNCKETVLSDTWWLPSFISHSIKSFSTFPQTPTSPLSNSRCSHYFNHFALII